MIKKILFVFLVCSISDVLANELKSSSSPYLAMHGDDPVEWHHLDRHNLAEAGKQEKLIYISSGYFSCHWCHVMQRESYQNEEIAQKLNTLFVPFKIDRELHPVVDAHLIHFIERSRGYAGWPLNVFLTPEGYPVFAMTYAPPKEFSAMLDKLNRLWEEDPDRVRRIAQSAQQEISSELLSGNEVSDLTPEALKQRLLKEMSLVMNQLQGGFGDGSKFPSVPQLQALLALGEEAEFLTTTLEAMNKLQLQDHINGGFFRYTTDPDWQTPHFEKMLYDNAQLAGLYLRAAKQLDNKEYQDTGIRTLRFVVSQMQSPEGGFVSSLSAIDEHGVEGGYYLWTNREVRELLEPRDYALIEQLLGMEKPSRFDDGYLPPSLYSAPASQWLPLKRAYAVLGRAREKMASPPADDKLISGWNAQMLSSFADCVSLTKDPWCLAEGEKLVAFMPKFEHENMILHGLDRNGNSLGPGVLDDYAQIAQAYSDWWQATGDTEYKNAAIRVIKQAVKRFHSNKGWLASEKPLLPGLIPTRHLPDQVTSSGTAILLSIAYRLGIKLDVDFSPTRMVASNTYGNVTLITFLNKIR